MTGGKLGGRPEALLVVEIGRRVSNAKDWRVAAFASAAIDNVMRGIRIGELTNLLSKFDRAWSEKFKSELSTSGSTPNAYDNILNNRISFAHNRGVVQLTFQELCDYYDDGKKVITLFISILSEV